MAVWKDGKELKDIGYLRAGATDMLDQLTWWTKALKVARDQGQLRDGSLSPASERQVHFDVAHVLAERKTALHHQWNVETAGGQKGHWQRVSDRARVEDIAKICQSPEILET